MLRRSNNNIDIAQKLIQDEKKKNFMIEKDSVNLHTFNRKRKLNETFNTQQQAEGEVDAVFNETDSMPTTDRTKTYLRIKISTIIGKNYF